MERRILLMKAAPSHAPEIGEQLARLPGVNHVFVADGQYQLVAMIAGKTEDDLSALVDRHIATLEGVEIGERLTALRQYSHDEANDEMIGFGP